MNCATLCRDTTLHTKRPCTPPPAPHVATGSLVISYQSRLLCRSTLVYGRLQVVLVEREHTSRHAKDKPKGTRRLLAHIHLPTLLLG